MKDEMPVGRQRHIVAGATSSPSPDRRSQGTDATHATGETPMLPVKTTGETPVPHGADAAARVLAWRPAGAVLGMICRG